MGGFKFSLPGCYIEELKKLLEPAEELINKFEGENEVLVTKNIFKLPQEALVKTAIGNYIKKLTVDFVNESYFLHDKSNLIKETFITELNKTALIYGSISYFAEKKQEDEIFQIVSPKNYLEFFVTKDTTKKN